MENDINCTQLYVIAALKDYMLGEPTEFKPNVACSFSTTYVFSLHGSNTS